MSKRKITSAPSTPICTLSKVKLDADLSAALGRPVQGYTSQTGTSYGYGYSNVTIPGLISESKVVGAHGRREGDDGDRNQRTREMTFESDNWYEQLVSFAVNILSAGRTVECGPGAGINELRRRNPHGQTVNVPLDSLCEEIVTGALCLSPDYQRGAVWTDAQASRFVGHWLEDGEIPKFWIQRWDSNGNVCQKDLENYSVAPAKDAWCDLPQEVIDGQQRMRALHRWYRGEISAELTDGRTVAYSETNEQERRGFDVVLTYVDLPRAERLRLYLRLNRGGTVHTDEEIAKVREMLEAESV